jgi:hypothetical protein
MAGIPARLILEAEKLAPKRKEQLEALQQV